MKKSRREWLMEAKQQGYEWAGEALENTEKRVSHVLEVSPSEALLGAFSWSRSPQGHPYWDGVYYNLIDQGK